MFRLINDLIEKQESLMDIKYKIEQVKDLSEKLEQYHDSQNFDNFADTYCMMECKLDNILECLNLVLGEDINASDDDEHAMQCIKDLQKYFNNDDNDDILISSREDFMYASELIDGLWRFAFVDKKEIRL